MDNSFYLKNGSVLWNGAFTPLDMAVEDGHITALSRGHHNEKGLPEVDAAGLRVLPGFLDLHTHGAAGVDVNAADAEGLWQLYDPLLCMRGWLDDPGDRTEHRVSSE